MLLSIEPLVPAARQRARDRLTDLRSQLQREPARCVELWTRIQPCRLEAGSFDIAGHVWRETFLQLLEKVTLKARASLENEEEVQLDDLVSAMQRRCRLRVEYRKLTPVPYPALRAGGSVLVSIHSRAFRRTSVCL